MLYITAVERLPIGGIDANVNLSAHLSGGQVPRSNSRKFNASEMGLKHTIIQIMYQFSYSCFISVVLQKNNCFLLISVLPVEESVTRTFGGFRADLFQMTAFQLPSDFLN